MYISLAAARNFKYYSVLENVREGKKGQLKMLIDYVLMDP